MQLCYARVANKRRIVLSVQKMLMHNRSVVFQHDHVTSEHGEKLPRPQTDWHNEPLTYEEQARPV